jgi:DNA-binding MarR family transcriptional regulator
VTVRVSSDETYELLAQFLLQLQCLADAEAIDTLVDTDLSFSQVRAIFALAMHDAPIPINELAHGLRISMAAAGRTVDQLATGGLVDRREDPRDRRVRRISLSEAGRTLTKKYLDARRGALRGFVQRLRPDDRERLRTALRPILDGESRQPVTKENPA